jgi:hypothetical protein
MCVPTQAEVLQSVQEIKFLINFVRTLNNKFNQNSLFYIICITSGRTDG